MSHLNTSIYHCLAVAAKSFLSWDRRICEKCFLRLGKAAGCCLTLPCPCDVYEWTLSSRSSHASCLSSMSTCHSSSHDVNWKTSTAKCNTFFFFWHSFNHTHRVALGMAMSVHLCVNVDSLL